MPSLINYHRRENGVVVGDVNTVNGRIRDNLRALRLALRVGENIIYLRKDLSLSVCVERSAYVLRQLPDLPAAVDNSVYSRNYRAVGLRVEISR